MRREKVPFVTIGLPTLNEEKRIYSCLSNIRKQIYPKDKIEIVIADGGSTDNTLKIAKKFNCRIIKNPDILAEPGLARIYPIAKGGYMVFMAADNILHDKNWLNKMVKPFIDNPNKIYASFSKVTNKQNDNSWNKFVNEDADPFSSFVFGNTSHPEKFPKVYSKILETKDYVVYDYDKDNFPLIALAQGTLLKTGLNRHSDSRLDDILPLIRLIEDKKQIAFVKNTSVYHFSIKGFYDYCKKLKRRIYNSMKTNSYLSREEYVSPQRKIRRYLFIIFSITILPMLFNAIYLTLQKRRIYMLLYLPGSLIITFYIFYSFLKIKIWQK